MLLPERRGPGNKKNLKRKVERRFRKLRSVTNMFFEKNMLFHNHKCMFLLEADMYIFIPFTSRCLQPACRHPRSLSRMELLIALVKCMPEMQPIRPHRMKLLGRQPKKNRQGVSPHELVQKNLEPHFFYKDLIPDLQVKAKLKSFMDSMLTKAGKIRGLVRDLKQNYAESNAMAM